MATADRPQVPKGVEHVQTTVVAGSPHHYVHRRSQELLKRYTGTRARRQQIAEQMGEASQYQLMLAKFRKHRVATVSFYLLVILYAMAIFAPFVVPYDTLKRFDQFGYAKPSRVRIVDTKGNVHLPFIYARTSKLNLKTFKYTFEDDPSKQYPVRLFVSGEPYRLFGVISMQRHLFGVEGNQPIFLLGSDKLGRDLFSRIIFAARVSLFIGFAGVIISFVLGVILGGISGYFGGVVDTIIQRVIEFLMSIPQIPLWMALSAAIPQEWSGIQKFGAITVVLSFVGWTGLARVVRGKLISLREEDYVTAARISSAKPMQIIRRHLLPGVTSFLVVSITLAIPGMILGETTLSFLGLGITAPDVSWGSLLQEAQDVNVIANYPWILAPVFFVMLAVVLFNFIGDGLRDAADPYSR
jgi:peptide/nickel transport system permease protein